MQLPFVLVGLSLLGMLLAYLYGRHTKEFRFREYVALLFVPIACVAYLIYENGINLLYFFLASAIVGLILEYSVGLLYHKTLNRRLWTYSRYDLSGYTSWLVLPMRGIAGVMFWVLSKKFGL